MNSSSLSAELQQWANEYASIASVDIDVPPKLWAFLAQRIAEAGLVDEPEDVVRMELDGTVRKVRITGHSKGQLSWSYADGSPGFGFARVSSVVQDDHAKLADILDQIEGKQCPQPVAFSS